MSHTREEVVAVAKGKFPAGQVSEVMEILDLYGIEPHENERERVQLAILKLSDGDEGELLHFVEAAKQDYRDVLFWADHSQESSSEAQLLEILRKDWAWALPDPARVVAINPFGNVVVACADRSLWRVCPESLTADKISDESDFAAVLADEEFCEDWLFDGPVTAAHSSLGPFGDGQCYGFKIWPALGGAYTPDNFAIKTLTEWLAVSGDVGRQVKDIPPGTEIELDTFGDS